RPLVAGMTLVLAVALVPRALADEGDDMPFDIFQFEPPAELAFDQPPPEAAADRGGGDQSNGGGEVTAGPAPTQDEGGGGSGALDPGGGGDDPQRLDVPLVAQADEEMSVRVSVGPEGIEP